MTTLKRILLVSVLLLVAMILLAQTATVRAIPPEQNGQPAATVSTFLPAIFTAPGCAQSFAFIPPDNLDYELQVVALINQERANNNLPALSIASELTQAARLESRFLADNDYWGHDWPDGTTPWDRIHWACYDFRAAGENIAAGQQTPAEVVGDWMDSPGHRAIILEAAFKEVGVGYAYNASSTYKRYWTADFGAR